MRTLIKQQILNGLNKQMIKKTFNRIPNSVVTGNPLRLIFIDGIKSRFQGNFPCLSCASFIPATSPLYQKKNNNNNK